MDAIYTYPAYFEKIISRLIKRNWLVHNFENIEDEDVYNLSNYLYNKDFNGLTYTLHLDVNIYQFIVNSVKKRRPKSEYRDAIALVCYCQLSEIEIDPTIAVYEKLSYSKDESLLKEVIKDLELFNRINNIDDAQLIEYAFSEIEEIEPQNNFALDREKIGNNLTKYKRLLVWDSLYLLLQYITYISLDREKTNSEKLRVVVEWMITDFRMSLVCMIYAIVYFSKKPLRRMMKFKITDPPSIKKRALINMTWDLYALYKYFKSWTEKDDEQEIMYASNDIAFNNLLRISVDVQLSGNLFPLEDYVDMVELGYLEKITSKPDQYFERIYGSENWNAEYRERLIKKYDSLLGISEK